VVVDIIQCLSTVELESKSAKALALYVKNTGNIKGRGVFAGRRFSIGELVEAAPVIVFEAGMMPRILANILYDWERHTGEPKARAIALGYGSLYNHDNPANLKYIVDGPASVIHFVALRDIVADEELTINYNHAGGRSGPGSDSWFKNHQVKPYSRMQPE
jgi:uncharacterized protein